MQKLIQTLYEIHTFFALRFSNLDVIIPNYNPMKNLYFFFVFLSAVTQIRNLDLGGQRRRGRQRNGGGSRQTSAGGACVASATRHRPRGGVGFAATGPPCGEESFWHAMPADGAWTVHGGVGPVLLARRGVPASVGQCPRRNPRAPEGHGGALRHVA